MRWRTRAEDDEARLAILDVITTTPKSIMFIDTKTHQRFSVLVDRFAAFSMKGIYIDMERQNVYNHCFHNIHLLHPVVYADEWTSVILKLHTMFHITSLVCMDTRWVHQYRQALTGITVDHETDVDDMLSLNIESTLTKEYPDRVVITHVDTLDFYVKLFEYQSQAKHIVLDMPTIDIEEHALINHMAMCRGFAVQRLYKDRRFTVNLYTRVVSENADNCEDFGVYQS